MNATIQKWGNSLALRIPVSFAKDIHIHRGSKVNVALEKNKIIVTPKKPARYTLSEMVKKINKHNLHAETDWGPPQGKEIW